MTTWGQGSAPAQILGGFSSWRLLARKAQVRVPLQALDEGQHVPQLDYIMVEADIGTIGGSASHEFMVVAETGESAVVHELRAEGAIRVVIKAARSRQRKERRFGIGVKPLHGLAFLP